MSSWVTAISVSKPVTEHAYVFMGGTFDPIHHGHLRTALELQQWLQVPEVALVPSKTPVHRQAPGRSSEQRLQMVELAVADEPALCVDPREVLSTQPSYSLLTLQAMRAEFGPKRPICMIMGMDAFQTLPSWHEWQQFIELCHLIVVKRPGYQLPATGEIGDFTRKYKVEDRSAVLRQPAGAVLFHELTPLGISATQIRETIARGDSPRYLFPEAVWQYIKDNRLYGLTN